jgi:hypothetical protein
MRALADWHEVPVDRFHAPTAWQLLLTDHSLRTVWSFLFPFRGKHWLTCPSSSLPFDAVRRVQLVVPSLWGK